MITTTTFSRHQYTKYRFKQVEVYKQSFAKVHVTMVKTAIISSY